MKSNKIETFHVSNMKITLSISLVFVNFFFALFTFALHSFVKHNIIKHVNKILVASEWMWDERFLRCLVDELLFLMSTLQA